MRIVLHLATSADGFIAKPDGDSDWVSSVDEELFKKRAQELGAPVVGQRTYEQYKGAIYPVKGALNMISTSKALHDQDVLPVPTIEAAIKTAKDHHCNGLLVAGGARTAASFLYQDLVDEVFLSIHPLMLHEGIPSPFKHEHQYKLADKTPLQDGIVQEHFVRSKR